MSAGRQGEIRWIARQTARLSTLCQGRDGPTDNYRPTGRAPATGHLPAASGGGYRPRWQKCWLPIRTYVFAMQVRLHAGQRQRRARKPSLPGSRSTRSDGRRSDSGRHAAAVFSADGKAPAQEWLGREAARRPTPGGVDIGRRWPASVVGMRQSGAGERTGRWKKRPADPRQTRPILSGIRLGRSAPKRRYRRLCRSGRSWEPSAPDE